MLRFSDLSLCHWHAFQEPEEANPWLGMFQQLLRTYPPSCIWTENPSPWSFWKRRRWSPSCRPRLRTWAHSIRNQLASNFKLCTSDIKTNAKSQQGGNWEGLNYFVGILYSGYFSRSNFATSWMVASLAEHRYLPSALGFSNKNIWPMQRSSKWTNWPCFIIP